MNHISLCALLTLQCVVLASSLDVSPAAGRILASFKKAYPFPQSKDRVLEHVLRDKVERRCAATGHFFGPSIEERHIDR